MSGLDGTAKKRTAKPPVHDLNTFVGWLYPTVVAIGGLAFVNWYFDLRWDDLFAAEFSRWWTKGVVPFNTLRDILRIVFP